MKSSFKYNIFGVEIVSKELKKFPGQSFKGEFFNFDINTDSRVILEQDTIGVGVTIAVRDGSSTENCAFFEFVFFFRIENLKSLVSLNENNYAEIPTLLEDQLKFESISTSRGILFGELRGTYLQGALLPFFDIDTMVRIPKT